MVTVPSGSMKVIRVVQYQVTAVFTNVINDAIGQALRLQRLQESIRYSSRESLFGANQGQDLDVDEIEIHVLGERSRICVRHYHLQHDRTTVLSQILFGPHTVALYILSVLIDLSLGSTVLEDNDILCKV